MTGATIDHLVALTVFLAAILLFISLFNQTIQTAILYQQHRYLSTRCSDLIDSVALDPGYPYDWGTNGVSMRNLTFFGLQDPEFQQYRLSPFSLMRLLSSSGQEVFYNETGKSYSNVSWGSSGGYVLVQESECVNYSNASRLLGTNGSYGFQLSITPTVSITVSEIQQNPLKLKIQAYGLGFPISNATLHYLMFWSNTSQPDKYPILNNSTDSPSEILQTDSTGIAYKEFTGLNVENNKTAYAFIVRASVGGLCGTGYLARDAITGSGNLIPFVDNLDSGAILLAQKWGKSDPQGNPGALFFRASFYILADNFTPILTEDLTNNTDYGNGTAYRTMNAPLNNTGFLVAAYHCDETNDYGMAILPWGIGGTGNSITFGEDPSNKEWVATDLRQVLVGNIAYQTKLALWSLQGYQVIG